MRRSCLLAITLWLAACGRDDRPNVLFLTLDTTRADHIGAYGNLQSKTPNIDRIAQQAVLFERTMAAVPITLPSHSTIMTGRYPPGHGVRDNGLFRLGDDQVTLAEILQSDGYATAAAIGAFPLIGKFGIDQGFDFFNDQVTAELEDHKGDRIKEHEALYFDQRSAQQVNDAILPWIREHADQPFFAWLHYFDPHRPWKAKPPFSSRFPHDDYMAEIAYADFAFGQLLSELESLNLLKNTLIVITADHGEGLGQHHEDTHSLLNYNSTLHVPLIIRVPGEDEPRRVNEMVGTVDIVPTVLEALGIENRHQELMDGRSILNLNDQTSSLYHEPPPYYAETLSPRISQGWGELRTLMVGGFKYIHGPRPELFDLESDPEEERDLHAEEPQRAIEMEQELVEWLERFSTSTSVQIEADQETIQRLMSLGYLSGNAELPKKIDERLSKDGVPPQDRVVDNGLMSSAKDLIFRKQYGRASSLIDELRQRDPRNWVYLDMQVRVLMATGDWATARDELLRERIEMRLRPEHAITLARLLSAGSAVQPAIDILIESEAEQATAKGQYLLATLYERQGRKKMAGGALLAATQADPSFVPATISLAIRHAQAGQQREAEDLLQRVISRQPFHTQALYNLGALFAARGDADDAKKIFKRCLAIAPNYRKASEALALLEEGRDE